jgi:hypothetical protein
MKHQTKEETIIQVPSGCLSCGAKWIGGNARPGDKMTKGLRVFYDCGASMSIKEDFGERCYHILFKNCHGMQKRVNGGAND